jgi:hypothetical protein
MLAALRATPRQARHARENPEERNRNPALPASFM